MTRRRWIGCWKGWSRPGGSWAMHERLILLPGWSCPADLLEPLAAALRVRAGKGLDRKSTRLNSSHVKISYAVFCLKKKTPRTDTKRPILYCGGLPNQNGRPDN